MISPKVTNIMASTRQRKDEIRQLHSTFRRTLRATPAEKHRRDLALQHNLLSVLRETNALQGSISAYFPLPSEPGTPELPYVLAEHGPQVWLPISLPEGMLNWAQLTEQTAASQTSKAHSEGRREGRLGITEPVGARVDNEILRSCTALVLPALAADQTGTRLGKGAGYYDRALQVVHALPPAQRPTLIAVVYHEELLEHLPSEDHDVACDIVVTDQNIWYC